MLISAVIPLFNKERSVARAIRSYIGQKHQDCELIIVDDGSTDRSVAALEPFLTLDGISLVRQQNQGVSKARNVGLEQAKSDYVAFLDADDEWQPDHLANINSLIEANPNASLYCTKSGKIDETGRAWTAAGRHDPLEPGRLTDFYDTYHRCQHIVNSSSACVKKAAFLACEGFPVGRTTGEDIYLWFRLAAIGDVMYSPAPTARIDLGAENRSTTRRTRCLPYHLEYFLVQGHLSDIPRRMQSSARSALLQSALLNCAGAVLSDNRPLARSYISALARHDLKFAAMACATCLTPRVLLLAARTARRAHTSRASGVP